MSALLNRVELAVRLSCTHTGFETRGHKKSMICPILHISGGDLVAHRHPSLNASVGVIKPGRKDADHGVALGIEENRLADDRRISGIAALPQPIAENDRPTCAD